jgi:hypothetical protein
MNKRSIVTGALLVMLISASCFSPMGPDGMGTISIGTNSRGVLVTPAIGATLAFEVTFTGPGGTITKNLPPGALTTTVQVVPGNWTVTIRAADTSGLRAYGKTPVTVPAGKNVSADIAMITAAEVDTVDTLRTEVEDATIVAGTEKIIFITKNILLDSSTTSNSFVPPPPAPPTSVITKSTGGTIRLVSAQGRKEIGRSDVHRFFYVSAGNLILGEEGEANTLVLNGNNIASSQMLIYAGGGKLIMNGNTELINNDGASSDLSAVYVNSIGTFEMNGGIIKGNKAQTGGGVGTNGIFTMNGGIISGNTANSGTGIGGGVYVVSSGTFTMNGGIIYGSSAGVLANTAVSGSSLYVDGIAQYGDLSPIILTPPPLFTDDTLYGRH